jgi:hypothetical protein
MENQMIGTKLFGRGLLAATLTLVAMVIGPAARAQSGGNGEWQRFPAMDVGATFTTERSKVVAGDCGCFWLQGGSAEAAIHVWRDISAAVNLTGGHASDIGPGVDIAQIAVMGGPRYTFGASRWTDHWLHDHHTSVFGEALFGGVHAFDGAYPSSTGFKSSATALSMQFGGGIDVHLAKRFNLRAIEVDYVRTSLPNGTTDSQHDLRLAIGLTYHLHPR